MTDKQIIIDGKTIGCPCYIDRPLYRYDKACLVQSQSFTEQQTEEKPILRCDEIKNCPIKENYKQLTRKTQECEILKEINAEIQESEIELENMKNSLFIDYMKYKQAIEEIKEIVTALCYTVMSDGVVTLQKDILQIIQKCEEVNNDK